MVEDAALADDVAILKNVHLRYGAGDSNIALNNVNLRLSSGGLYVIQGASGAGKTSLLRLIALEYKPTSGQFTLFGHDVGRLPPADLFPLRQRLGIVFQDFRLINHLNLFDNVALPMRLVGAPEKEICKRVGEMLAWIGLSSCANRFPPTLSGGDKQCVAIARAVILWPKLLLADEPTGSVDPATGKRLLSLFSEMNRLGGTVVITTHDEKTPSYFPNARLLHLENGRLTSQKTNPFSQVITS